MVQTGKRERVDNQAEIWNRDEEMSARILRSGGLVERRPLESNRLTSKEKREFPDGRAADFR